MATEVLDVDYTFCFCEENVYKLCHRFRASGVHDNNNCYVVFISNPQKSDYHVILVERTDTGGMVYDPDAGLDFPCDIATYMRLVIRENPSIERYHRHMLDMAGNFVATPPTWDPIFDLARGHNLDDFVSMDPAKLTEINEISEVYDLPSFKLLMNC